MCQAHLSGTSHALSDMKITFAYTALFLCMQFCLLVVA